MQNILLSPITEQKFTTQNIKSIQEILNSSKYETGMFESAVENKKIIDDFINEAYKNFSFDIVNKYFAKNFIKHRSWHSDGVNHAKELYMFNFKYTPYRWAAQNDLVISHGVYQLSDNLDELAIHAVDLWRVDAGKIVEHWNVVELIPYMKKEWVLNGAGNGDGLLDNEKAMFRMGLISSFSHLAYLGYKQERLQEYLDESFIFHHRDHTMNHHQFNQYFSSLDVVHFENKKIVASGDLVFSYNFVHYNNLDKINVDIFRLNSQDKIVEMWSVNQGVITKIKQDSKLFSKNK